MKRSVTVQIAGVRYALKTDEDDRWVKSVASFVEEKIRDVQKRARTPDTQAAAVLTALTWATNAALQIAGAGADRLIAQGFPRRLCAD